MQAALAVVGVVRRWSGVTNLIMLGTIAVLPTLARLLPTEPAISWTRTVSVTYCTLHPGTRWERFGFIMNGGSPPSPRWPRFGNGGVNVAAGLTAAGGDRGRSDPAFSWMQIGAGTGPAKVSVVEANGSGATVTVEVPGIQTESVAVNGTQYLKLAIPGAVSAGLDVGKPEVPAVPVLLARPTGSTVTLRMLSMQTETLRVARVFPMQPPLKLGEQAGPLVVDSAFYAGDVEYPSDRLSSPRTATWRDLDVVNVHVYPVVVRPAQHEVVVTSRMTFRVDFSGGRYPATVANWMPPMYRRLILNYDGLGLATTAQEPPGTKCLVLCNSRYFGNPALDSLLNLMTMLGCSTEIDSEPYGVPPEVIKQAITSRYFNQNKALHWVLLVGDYHQIPSKQYNHSGPLVYGDYWYSDLSLDSLGCDNYPEIGIARLSPAPGPNDTQNLRQQIAKIRAYRMGTHAGDWLKKTTLVASKLDWDTGAVRGAATMRLSFYPDGIRDTIMGYIPSVNNTSVANAVNQGTGVLVYLGHGEYDRWLGWNTTNDSDWTSQAVSGLSNTNKTPVVFDLACNCGNPASGTCLSQQWMWDSGGNGAVASFASSSLIDTGPAKSQCSLAVGATGDYHALQYGSTEYLAPVFDLGGIQMLMDAYIATNFPTVTSNIYSFMWLGDPSMPVWSGGIPTAVSVSYPAQIQMGVQCFHVRVRTKSDNQPVENARVCVYKPNDFYAVGLTNASGEVTLSLTASSVGSLYVSASEGHELLSSQGSPHTPMLPYFGASCVGVSSPYPNSDRVPLHWSLSVSLNPARGAFSVRYDVPHQAHIVVGVHDVDGRLVRSLSEGEVAPGRYETKLSSGTLPAGVYFCTLSAENQRFSRKVVLTE